MMQTLGDRFNPRENNFDLIRIIAAIVVVFAHSYSLARKEYDPLSSFLTYEYSGTLAVWAFLIVSGFLVSRSSENNDLTSFVIARFLRIYPGFVLIVLVESFIIAPTFYEGPLSEYFHHFAGYHLRNLMLWPQDPYLPKVFTTLPNGAINGSLWTVPLEISFYIVLVTLTFIAELLATNLYLMAFAASLIGHAVMAYYGVTSTSPPFNLLDGISLYQFVAYSSYFLAGGVCVEV